MNVLSLLLPLGAVLWLCLITALARWDHQRRVRYWESREKKLRP